MQRLLVVCFVPLLLNACFHDESAVIVRTQQGIPHITSSTWLGLGYGYGYAYAQDNFCMLMKDVVRANGESARYLGSEGSIENDFLHKLYNEDSIIANDFISEISQQGQDVMEGFTDGMNRYLEETGADNLAQGDDGCRSAEWVRPLNQLDLAKVMRKVVLVPSSGSLAGLIALVDGPDNPLLTKTAPNTQKTTKPHQIDKTIPQLTIAADAIPLPRIEEIGSNVYGIGGDLTDSGQGLLLGNPHFPWNDSMRFYMAHLEMEGEYNVMGASLHGFPLINIGYNQDVAWSHAVSRGKRFTFHEVRLDPTNPMKYLYGDEIRDIETRTVSAEVPVGDGSFLTLEHTYYFTHYGPILDLSPLNPQLIGWPNVFGTVFAVQDVNLPNTRSLDTWRMMGAAKNIDELVEAGQHMGNPWTNTVAVDRNGEAFYGDLSATPHVTAALLNECVRGFAAPALTAAGFVTLDGSDPACEWGNDEDSQQEGILGFSQLPTLKTRDYALNSNDSHWLTNENMLLEGFSPILGDEQTEQILRSRLAHIQIRDRLSGEDGLGEGGFNNQNMREIMFGNRNYGAELITDAVVEICSPIADWSAYSSNPQRVAEACGILEGWDRKSELHSIGTHIFLEMWIALEQGGAFWAVPFDISQPVDTPNTLDVENPDIVERVKLALGYSVDRLLDAGVELNQPWGELQYSTRQGETIPIHGSIGFGFSVIKSDLIAGEGYSEINFGNSYIQVVGFNESDCPDTQALLAYSQSSDPESEHYADSTQLYSQKQWTDVPYCYDEILQSKIGEVITITKE